MCSALRSLQYTLIPRATHSLKLLCETPLFLLQLFQTLATQLHAEYVELVPLLVRVLSPAPTPEQLCAPSRSCPQLYS